VSKFLKVQAHFKKALGAVFATQQIQGGGVYLQTEFIFPHQQPDGNCEIVFFPALAVTAETRY
jgi:hypothetical protein